MTTGIYKLNFPNTSKVYVGKSGNVEQRFIQHLSNYKLKTISKKLLSAFDTYGEPTIEILEVCSIENLSELENKYIKKLNAVLEGFNTLNESDDIPIGIGELNGRAVHTNAQIEEAFKLLLDVSNSISTIGDVTGVSIGTIRSISKGSNHSWLKDKYPKEYEILISLKHTRQNGGLSVLSKYSNSKIIEVFNLLTDHKDYKTLQSISNTTGVDVGTVRSISCKENHKWLEEMYPERYPLLDNRVSSPRSKRFTKEELIEVFELLISSPEKTFKDIEEITGVCKNTIRDISCLKTNKWLKLAFPEKYSELEKLKGNRKKPLTSLKMGLVYPPIKSPTGEIYENISNVSKFAKEHNLTGSHLATVLKGTAVQHKGWKLA